MTSRPAQSLPIVESPKATALGSDVARPTGHRAIAPAVERGSEWGSALTGRVQAILDLIRPAIQEDGGDVELVAITPDGQVQVRFHGACVGCPSSPVTLQSGIERNLREHVPEVTGVVAVP